MSTHPPAPEPRVPTEKWRHLPEPIDPAELVETVAVDPRSPSEPEPEGDIDRQQFIRYA